MKSRLCVLFAMLFVTTLALAHGNYQHVMGTLTKISENSITVQTTTNDIVEVTISPETKFSKGDAAVTGQDMRVGDRVVIHAAKTNDGKLVAHTVQIGVAKAPATSH
jgi:carbonic anhydrase/acetyltransferase-like protein (isoleucine patch superfamily)